MKWQASAQIGVRTTGGFAAAQCGKASPFRVLVSNLSREAKPRASFDERCQAGKP